MVSREESRQRIEAWMELAQSRGDWEIELHVDNLDPELVGRREMWLPAAVHFLKQAVELRDAHGWPLVVEASIDLGTADRERGQTFADVDELRAEVAEVPPSLFCYPETLGADLWEGARAIAVTGLRVRGTRLLLWERSLYVEGEYQRRLMIIAPPGGTDTAPGGRTRGT